MGYMDLSIGGVDDAAGMMIDIVESTVKALREALQEEGNTFNPSGAVNVGLFFEEVISKNPGPWANSFSEDLYSIAKMARDRLDTMEIPKASAKNKEDWGDEGNRMKHLNRYRAIKRSIDKFIKYVDEADARIRVQFG